MFIREQFVSGGMCADCAIHDTDGHNPHAHILLTVRPLDEQGKWQYKAEKTVDGKLDFYSEEQQVKKILWERKQNEREQPQQKKPKNRGYER